MTDIEEIKGRINQDSEDLTDNQLRKVKDYMQESIEKR